MRFIDIDQSASFIFLDQRAGFCSFHQTMTIDSLFASIVATRSLDHQMVVLHFLRITGMPISYLVGPETNSEKNDLADGGPEPISASCNASRLAVDDTTSSGSKLEQSVASAQFCTACGEYYRLSLLRVDAPYIPQACA
jgi:hypothetical protein